MSVMALWLCTCMAVLSCSCSFLVWSSARIPFRSLSHAGFRIWGTLPRCRSPSRNNPSCLSVLLHHNSASPSIQATPVLSLPPDTDPAIMDVGSRNDATSDSSAPCPLGLVSPMSPMESQQPSEQLVALTVVWHAEMSAGPSVSCSTTLWKSRLQQPPVET